MGYGEYGGNGSVHWTNTNKKDRNNGGGTHSRTYQGVDNQPANASEGQYIVIQISNVNIGDIRLNAGTLTVRVPIQFGGIYQRQVLVTWPPDDLPLPATGEVQAV